MIIWIVALHCEAKPVIDFYRLKKSPDHHAFDLYQHGDMVCVVSGMGKIASAAATAWAAALFHPQPSIAWINLGIAGTANDRLGSAFWINKISTDQNQHYFPIAVFSLGLESRSCQTLDEPSVDYDNDILFDMEASAFFATATRFSSAELVHCIKVVSDNRENLPTRDKAAISQLIADNTNLIDQFVVKLRALNGSLVERSIDDEVWQAVIGQAKFSRTQQAQLKPTLRFLRSRNIDLNALQQHIAGLSTSRDILKRLDQLRHHESRNL